MFSGSDGAGQLFCQTIQCHHHGGGFGIIARDLADIIIADIFHQFYQRPCGLIFQRQFDGYRIVGGKSEFMSVTSVIILLLSRLLSVQGLPDNHGFHTVNIQQYRTYLTDGAPGTQRQHQKQLPGFIL